MGWLKNIGKAFSLNNPKGLGGLVKKVAPIAGAASFLIPGVGPAISGMLGKIPLLGGAMGAPFSLAGKAGGKLGLQNLLFGKANTAGMMEGLSATTAGRSGGILSNLFKGAGNLFGGGGKGGQMNPLLMALLGGGGASGLFGQNIQQFLTGKEGKFDQFNVDPNYATYQAGLARTTQALEDPNKNPFFRAAMRDVKRPGVHKGAEMRGRAKASLIGADTARQGYLSAYGPSQPIVTYSGQTQGALPSLARTAGAYYGGKAGTTGAAQQPAFDFNSMFNSMSGLFKNLYQGGKKEDTNIKNPFLKITGEY